MNKDRVSYYTNKITSESMTGIICTMYEMFFEYIKDAQKVGSVRLDDARKASRVLEHLKDSLNFEYEISGNLFALYDFCERQIAKAMYTGNAEHFDPVKKVMGELWDAFIEVNKQDHSGAAMQNSQKVSAGLTYGRNDLTEIMDVDGNRGFLV